MSQPFMRNRGNYPRYGFVLRPNAGGEIDAYYDIVDNVEGSEQVLAYRVRHRAALEIVSALNAREEVRRVARNE